MTTDPPTAVGSAQPGKPAPVDDLAVWQQRLESTLRALSDNGDGSHDIGHYQRVWRLAKRIAGGLQQPVDLLVLLASCFLHDVVALEKNDPQRAAASRLAAEKARTILTELGLTGDRLDAVAHAIESHSFSAGIAPRTIEAKILQDADRIEALGALGVARLFYVAGRMGIKLFDDADPLAQKRSPDDQRFALDHYYTKLQQLPARMNTEPGRSIAEERAKFLGDFIDTLVSEAFG